MEVGLAIPRGRRIALGLMALVVALVAWGAAPASASAQTPQFGSGMSVGRNADGRLEAFAVDLNGWMVFNYQLSANGTAGWNGWRKFETARTFGLARPAVGRNADGRLEVFAQSGGDLYHRWQLAPNGSWSGWANLGGNFAAMSFTRPIVANSADGRLEVFAVDRNGDLVHIYQRTNGTWSGWLNHGGDYDPGALPAAGMNSDGRLEVFMIDVNGEVWNHWQTAPNGGLSGRNSLGGDVLEGSGWGPTVALNRSGRLELFVTGRDHRLYRKTQTATSWTGWSHLGGGIDNPVAARNQDGRVEVFAQAARGPQGGSKEAPVMHAYERTDGSWSGWTVLAGGFPGTFQQPTVAMNPDGRLEVFSQVYTGDDIYHSWQLAPNGGWSGFTILDR